MLSKACTVKGDLGLPDDAFLAVQNQGCCTVYVFINNNKFWLSSWGGAKNADVILDGNDTKKPVGEVIHPHLEDVLTHFQAEGHFEEYTCLYRC